eukprot:1753728-Karenia_brevis.AAC.1
MEHFGKAEAAVVMSPQAYINDYCAGLDAVANHKRVPSIDNIQPICDLISSYSHAKSGKAADLHGIHAEFLSAAPVEAAMLMHPLN